MADNCPKGHTYNVNYKKLQEKDKILIKRCPYCSLTIMQNQETCERDQCDGDHRLITWNNWVKERNKQTKALAKKVDRPPVDLVMNLLEKTREDKERKLVLEHAQIETKPKIRGGTLWEQPLRLKQPCPCRQVYEVQRTHAEVGKPRIVEHIGVPKYIQAKEKGLRGTPERPICKNLDLQYTDYRKRRENDLKDSIQKIDPFGSSLDDLILKGSRPKPPPKKLPTTPVISIIMDAVPPRYNLSNVYALKINKSIFFKEQEGQEFIDLRKMKEEGQYENCTSWTHYFNVPIKRAGRSSIFLENLGTVSLRYCWKKLKKPIPFIPEEQQHQVFFFNKNEDVLSPGQCRNIPITFFSDKVGLFSEFWELSICNCSFFDNSNDKFVINLYADIVEDVDRIKADVKSIKYNIVSNIKYNIARSIYDDIVAKATIIEPEMYAYKKMMLEEELFVMNNPVCFYHQTEVQKMKDVYRDMLPGEEWDLSIVSWRKAMMDKEYDERMFFYASLRHSHDDLLKPWYEGDELLKEKHRAVSQILGQLADKFDLEFDRIPDKLGVKTRDVENESLVEIPSESDILTSNTIHGVFYLSMHDHIADAVELCAGVLNSLDRNRWIDFNFCRMY